MVLQSLIDGLGVYFDATVEYGKLARQAISG